MKRVALSEVKDDLSRFLRLAEKEGVIITRHGKPAGVLIGFESEDDWFDYRLENDPRFLARIETARRSIRAGRGVNLEDVEAYVPAVKARLRPGELAELVREGRESAGRFWDDETAGRRATASKRRRTRSGPS